MDWLRRDSWADCVEEWEEGGTSALSNVADGLALLVWRVAEKDVDSRRRGFRGGGGKPSELECT